MGRAGGLSLAVVIGTLVVSWLGSIYRKGDPCWAYMVCSIPFGILLRLRSGCDREVFSYQILYLLRSNVAPQHTHGERE